MAITRLETPSQFRTNVTRQIILALRDVFGTSIFSQDFTNGINVVNSYPLTEIKYPAIVVTVNVRVNRNAGVGHTEEFQDMTTGMMRSWQHRYFEGEVEFTAVALDPFERDILYDALHDVLAFSHLSENEVLNAFFTRMQATPDAIGTVFQVNLSSDEIMGGGDSVSVAPWQPEDVLLYESTCTVQIMGGYYNTVLADWPGYVVDVRLQEPVVLTFAADPELTPTDGGHGIDASTLVMH